MDEKIQWHGPKDESYSSQMERMRKDDPKAYDLLWESIRRLHHAELVRTNPKCETATDFIEDAVRCHNLAMKGLAGYLLFARDAGIALNKARALVKHGEWGELLEEHFPAGRTTADTYRSIAKHWDEVVDPLVNSIQRERKTPVSIRQAAEAIRKANLAKRTPQQPPKKSTKAIATTTKKPTPNIERIADEFTEQFVRRITREWADMPVKHRVGLMTRIGRSIWTEGLRLGAEYTTLAAAADSGIAVGTSVKPPKLIEDLQRRMNYSVEQLVQQFLDSFGLDETDRRTLRDGVAKAVAGG